MEAEAGSALPLHVNSPGSQNDMVHLGNSSSIQERTCSVEDAHRDDELDAAEEEMLSDRPGDSVSRAATPSEELERDLLGETDSSTLGNEIGGAVEGENDTRVGLSESCAAENIGSGGDTQNCAFRSLGTAVNIVAESVRSEVSNAKIVQEVESQDIESRDTGLRDIESLDLESRDKESRNLESQDVESQDVESQDVESQDVESQDVESQDVESQDVESRDVESRDVEPRDVEPRDVEPRDVEPRDVEPRDVEPRDVEPRDVEPRDVEPLDVEPRDVEPRDVEPRDVEPRDVEPQDVDSREGRNGVQMDSPKAVVVGDDTTLDRADRHSAIDEKCDASTKSDNEISDLNVANTDLDLHDNVEKNNDISLHECSTNFEQVAIARSDDQVSRSEDSFNDRGDVEAKVSDKSGGVLAESEDLLDDSALPTAKDKCENSPKTLMTEEEQSCGVTESSVKEQIANDKEECESGALDDVEMAPTVEESMEVMDCDGEDPFASGEKTGDLEVMESSDAEKTADSEKETDNTVQKAEDVTEENGKETDVENEVSETSQAIEKETSVENLDTGSEQDVSQEQNTGNEKIEDKAEDKTASNFQGFNSLPDDKESGSGLLNDSTVVPASIGRRKRSGSGSIGAHPQKIAKAATDSSAETIEVEVNPSVVCSDVGTANSETNKDDEEICIIPDDVPRVMPTMMVRKVPPTVISVNRKTNVVTKVKLDTTKGADKTNHIGSRSSEARRVPSRPQRQAAKKAESQIKELAQEESNSNEGFTEHPEDTDVMENGDEAPQMCIHCCRVRPCKYRVYVAGKLQFLCQDTCSSTFRKSRKPRLSAEQIGSRSLVRKCGQCCVLVTPQNEKTLSWETMDFCNEECLEKYQKQLGSHCANCKGPVQPTSLGKYCVRFGYDIKQFCCSSCLEEFKKGLKVCSYCQKDISGGAEGFLAPVGEKGQFKDFCTQSCMLKYNQMSNNQTPPPVKARCAVCNDEKFVKIEVLHGLKTNMLCSEPCFAAYKFVNSVSADQCDMCKKYFDKREIDNFSVFYDDAPHNFCCKTCMNVYILANRKIVPCTWCKVKKYNFDMIKRVTAAGQCLMMCSLSCLKLYSVSMSAVSNKKVKCDMCSLVAPAQYHLTMSDLSIRNFCNYSCVMQFQGQFSNAPLVVPKTTSTPLDKGNKPAGNSAIPVISSVHSLTTTNGKPSPLPNNAVNSTRSPLVKVKANNSAVPAPSVQAQQKVIQPAVVSPAGSVVKQQVIVKPPVPKQMRNKGVSCKPYMHTKGVGCRPHPLNKDTQTDDSLGKPVLIPVPVPIYVPAPMHMYSNPFPVPVPFPLPVPVPIFVPTTRNSAQGIMKEIKKIQEKIPTDPFEAELLMMAEMVAGEKKPELSDSESDDGGNDAGDTSEVAVEGVASAAEGGFSPEAVDTSNTFGEDMLQMALKMASELEEPAVDLEAALTPSTITAQSNPSMEQNDESEDDPEPTQNLPEQRPTSGRGRKRSVRSTTRGGSGGSTPGKRGRRISSSADIPLLPPPEPTSSARIEQEKPDANMCLKYTFGVNAWRHWVQTKNAELEKAATNNRKLKLFKPEILQLTADELNYSLCLFVKEVRKPNGQEYAPDTIYYLCLGIQQYLFENGRIDNIFTDSYYEKFTECLDEVARKFTALYNDSQFIVTRVEEEHLWESKQLGAHSPHVLLSTLLFFNTKHFNLTTVDEHMQLSFSHIMKHWKRNPNQPNVNKVSGSARNVLLRFYPPQSALDGNSKKKKLYEQLENEENPLRCPVKLYEFYLSKCPESVKTRNDVFYLLPERSCVPDSPVWYSTMALGREPLLKMLHRVKMVKEINMALLSS